MAQTPKRPDTSKLIEELSEEEIKEIDKEEACRLLGLDQIYRHRTHNIVIDNRLLLVTARLGCGNRRESATEMREQINQLQDHSRYVMDWDAKDDSTYACFLFDVTDRIVEEGILNATQ